MNDNAIVEAMPPDKLLALAVQQNAPIENLERLMALWERHQANQARAAYYRALSQFQSTVPRIHRSKHVDAGSLQYDYAPLADIVEQIADTLRACELTYTWEFGEHEGAVVVSCIITHVLGHSERNTLSAPLDDSGKKNLVQQRGSTVTYLQRYTLIGALGLTTADADIDGRLGTAGKTLTGEQEAELGALLSEVGADKGKFLMYFRIESVGDLPASRYAEAVKLLEAKRK